MNVLKGKACAALSQTHTPGQQSLARLVWDRIKVCCGVVGTEGEGLRERDSSGTVTVLFLCLWEEVGSAAEISVSCLCPAHLWLLALGLQQPPHLMWFHGAKNSCLRNRGQIGQIFVSCRFRGMATTILEKKWAGDFLCVHFAPFCRSFSGGAAQWLPGAMEYLIVENTREGVVYEKFSQSLVQTWSHLSRWWMWSTCCSEQGKTTFNAFSKIHAQNRFQFQPVQAQCQWFSTNHVPQQCFRREQCLVLIMPLQLWIYRFLFNQPH